jgi:hypothetical protein
VISDQLNGPILVCREARLDVKSSASTLLRSYPVNHTYNHSNNASDSEGFVLQVVLSLAVLAVFAAPVILAVLGL